MLMIITLLTDRNMAQKIMERRCILIHLQYCVIVEGDNTTYWRGISNNAEMQINLCCTYYVYCTWLD
jgi:hypothetical protein